MTAKLCCCSLQWHNKEQKIYLKPVKRNPKKPDFGFRNEIRVYIFGNRNSNLFFVIFLKKITQKLKNFGKNKFTHLFNVECHQNSSSNGQIWPSKKSYLFINSVYLGI